MIPESTNENVLRALREFDSDYRSSEEWVGWENKQNYKHAIRYNEKLYPPKQIISLATGTPVNSFSGGDEANNYLNQLKQANSKVILLNTLKFKNIKRTFVVAFGYAKSLFKEDVLEEQFGLKILLNSVNEDDLRKISKINVGGNQKQSHEQIPKTGKITEFGFDINRDLVRIVTAKTDDEVFEKGLLTGGDIFSVSLDCNINNIDEFLKICYERFNQTAYLKRFDWVDNIKEVRSLIGLII